MEKFWNDTKVWFKNESKNFLLAFLLLIIGWWLINKLSKVLIMFFQKSGTDPGIVSFLDSLLKFSLKAVLIITVLGTLGINVNSILAAIGAVFVTLGLAFKDNLSNVISGILLIVNKPIHIGDYIKVGVAEGKVTKIEMMSTTLQTSEENKIAIIPNAHLITSVITRSSDYNHLKVTKEIKFKLPEKPRFKRSLSLLKLYRREDPFLADVRKYLEKEIFLCKNILRVPEPKINFEEKPQGEINLKIGVWCESKNLEKARKNTEKITDKLKDKYKLEIIS